MNEQQYDQLLKIQTIGDQQGFPSMPHYHRYEPTPYEVLNLMMAQFEPDQNMRFVDFGSGKGRVPCYVHYKWRLDTLGIEMDENYVMLANENKAQYLRKHGAFQRDLSFHCTMAQNYKIQPADGLFFFFNPFSVQIFRRVVQNIIKSLERVPREAKIFLYYPNDEYIQLLRNETNFVEEQRIEIPQLSKHNEQELIICFGYHHGGY